MLNEPNELNARVLKLSHDTGLSVSEVNQSFIVGADFSTKDALFRYLASHASIVTGLPQDIILKAVETREAEKETGLGYGIAIPHGFVEGLKHPVFFLCTLKTPLEYGSLDGTNVDLVYLILSPPHGGSEHLMMLARAARVLSNKDTCAKIRGTTQIDTIQMLLGSSVGSA